MLRFFLGSKAKATDIKTTFTIKSNNTTIACPPKPMVSKSLQELQFAYGVIAKQVNSAQQKHDNYTISISLNGTLEGKIIELSFDNFNDLEKYLQENNAIAKSYSFSL